MAGSGQASSLHAIVGASRDERVYASVAQLLQRHSNRLFIRFEQVIPNSRIVVFINDVRRPSCVGHAVDVV